MSKHTPTPWQFDPNHGVISGTPRYLPLSEVPSGFSENQYNEVCCTTSHFNYDSRRPDTQRDNANGEFIVKAANCHDDFIAACKKMSIAVTKCLFMGDKDEQIAILFQANEHCRNALEKATGKRS